MRSKPKIAFFDFACCEGCQLVVLRLGEELFKLLEHVEVVSWREVMTTTSDEFDIAFCEGSIRWHKDLERIQKIRETAGILVTLGSCASIGCHNAIRNDWPLDTLRQTVYGDPEFPQGIITARPITAVVDVDYQTFGCPVSAPEFLKVFKSILTGQKYSPPNQPVCVECKLNDYPCVYEKNRICLGPVTRCGCNAACTRYGEGCRSCRGLMDGANLEGAVRALMANGGERHAIMERVVSTHGLSEADILRMFGTYNTWPKVERRDYQYED